MSKMYDVVIIGAGVTGCAIARELAKYDLQICVLEKEEDVCCGTSKANSGIVHAGFDATPGSLKAKMNVKGNPMIAELSKTLDFSFRKTGALVVCMREEDRPNLQKLYEKGLENGVDEIQILEREQLLKMEPNLSEHVVAALYAPTSGIVCPFEMTIAFAEHAAMNGVEFIFDTEVQQIVKKDYGYHIQTNMQEYDAKMIVNAAGVYADMFHNQVSEQKIHITARRGDYCLLDKSAGEHVGCTIFPLPTELGKGVLVSPTVHGNLIVGPTAIDIEGKEGTNTSQEGIDLLLAKATQTVDALPLRQVITSFAGLRAHEEQGDFIIGEVADAEGFFDAAGIESPGLTSAPAIGALVAEQIQSKIHAEKKEHYIETRKGIIHTNTLSKEEWAKLIEENPAYGRIICRCEQVTEGEMIDAIRRPLGARSLDGIKRRTRAGMGRCQSGFCSPHTMEILAREWSMDLSEVTKSGKHSKIIRGMNKEGFDAV